MKDYFNNRVAVVTGGAAGIGQAIVKQFESVGVKVCIFDTAPNPYFQGNLAKQADLDTFVQKVLSEHQQVDFIVNNAPPAMRGLGDCSYGDFQEALAVGLTAPFYLTQQFRPYLSPEAVIINISSTRDSMSQGQTESYSAAKGGLRALTHSLAMSLRGVARVNSISPGWIETAGQIYAGADAAQHLVGRVGRPDDIANLVLFLCSEQAAFITGENIVVDGGMSRQMIYHGDEGWSYQGAES